MRHRLSLCSAILIAGLCFVLPQALLAQQATITGTITEAGSGTPVENATVAVGDPSCCNQSPLATGTTDGLGQYSIDVDLGPGESLEVHVEAAGPAHAPARHGTATPIGCFFSCFSADGQFTIAEGATQANIDIELEAGGTISGTITAAADGTGLGGATLRMIRANGLEFSPHFWGAADAGGNYTTPLALPADDFYVLAHPPAGDNFVIQARDGVNCQLEQGCPLFDTDPVTIQPAVEETGVDFALQAGATISGSLLPDDIDRIVRLYDGSGKNLETLAFRFGDLTGDAWSFSGLSGGSYYIELGPYIGSSGHVRVLHNDLLCPFGGCDRARGAPVTVTPDASLSLPPFTLALGGQIEGTIVDAATGNAPPEVSSGAIIGNYDVIEADGTVVGGGSIREDGGEVVLMQSAGIPPGDYYVRTYSEWLGDSIGSSPYTFHDSITRYIDAAFPDVACAGNECDLASADTVTVTEGNVTSIQIGITAGRNISGRITDQDTTDGLADVVVKLVDADNKMLAAALTDANGEYQFGGFPAGSYYVRTSAAGRFSVGSLGVQNAYFDKVYGASGSCSELLCDPTDGSAVTIAGTSDTTGIDIAIESGPVISGQIISAVNGLPINNGRVEVYDSGGELVGDYKLAFTDARFQTTALAPGVYTLVAVVSPAYSGVSTSSDSGVSAMTLGSGPRAGLSGLSITVGQDSVEADLQVVDTAFDLLFKDDFVQ